MRTVTFRQILIFGGLITIFVICATWFVLSLRDESAKDRGKNQAAKQGDKNDGINAKADGKGSEKEPNVKRDDSDQDERRARSQARLHAVRNLKIEIGETLTTLETEVTAWETRIPGLMKGVDGKKIAANPARAEQFASLIEKDRVSKTRVRQLRERLDTLIGPIERAILDANTTYLPSDTVVADIEKIGEETRIKLRDFRDLKAVLDTLQSDSAYTAPSEKTLERVISDFSAEQTRQRGELIAKAKKETHDGESKRLAAAEGKAEQELATARLALLKARTEAEKQGIELQTEETKRKTDEAKEAEQKRFAKAKREAKFDAEYPAMKAYLIPFTSPGLNQFKGIYLQPSSDAKGPISFSKMVNNLKKDPNKTEHWARQMTDWGNDRPIGAFPIFYTGGAGRPGQLEVWYRVQDFLSEFGEIMVERKLLAP